MNKHGDIVNKLLVIEPGQDPRDNEYKHLQNHKFSAFLLRYIDEIIKEDKDVSKQLDNANVKQINKMKKALANSKDIAAKNPDNPNASIAVNVAVTKPDEKKRGGEEEEEEEMVVLEDADEEMNLVPGVEQNLTEDSVSNTIFLLCNNLNEMLLEKPPGNQNILTFDVQRKVVDKVVPLLTEFVKFLFSLQNFLSDKVEANESSGFSSEEQCLKIIRSVAEKTFEKYKKEIEKTNKLNEDVFAELVEKGKATLFPENGKLVLEYAKINKGRDEEEEEEEEKKRMAVDYKAVNRLKLDDPSVINTILHPETQKMLLLANNDKISENFANVISWRNFEKQVFFNDKPTVEIIDMMRMKVEEMIDVNPFHLLVISSLLDSMFVGAWPLSTFYAGIIDEDYIQFYIENMLHPSVSVKDALVIGSLLKPTVSPTGILFSLRTSAKYQKRHFKSSNAKIAELISTRFALKTSLVVLYENLTYCIQFKDKTKIPIWIIELIQKATLMLDVYYEYLGTYQPISMLKSDSLRNHKHLNLCLDCLQKLCSKPIDIMAAQKVISILPADLGERLDLLQGIAKEKEPVQNVFSLDDCFIQLFLQIKRVLSLLPVQVS